MTFLNKKQKYLKITVISYEVAVIFFVMNKNLLLFIIANTKKIYN